VLILGSSSGQGLSLSKQTELWGGATKVRIKANKCKNQAGNECQVCDFFKTVGPRHINKNVKASQVPSARGGQLGSDAKPR
jgi:hypothetical protein